MRPRSITLQHFGPYESHTVDLEPFQDAGLFLVHGDTGAGKSTLLDAMSWALYGKGLGDRTTDDMLRHVAAPADAATSVTLDFSLGDRFYRVARTVEPERSSRRGTVTRARTSASLQCLAGDPNFQPVGGTREVAREVGRLLHLPHEQFSRVIMLPQGEFRDLLLAPAERRERLLENLFGTARYALIEDQLRAMDTAARGDFDKADGVWRALLDGVGAVDLDDLDAKTTEARASAESVEVTIEAARRELDALVVARSVAAEVERRNATRRQHREALDGLRRGAESAAVDRERLARDEAASRCVDRLTRRRSLDEALRSRRGQFDRAEAEHTRHALALADPTLSPTRLEEAESLVRASLAQADALRAMAEEAERFTRMERDASAQAGEVARLEAALVTREQQLVEVTAAVATHDAAIAAHEAVIADEPGLRARFDNLSARQQRAVGRRTKEDELRGLQRAHRDAVAHERDAEGTWRDLSGQQARADAATRDELAARLALTLHAGEPCPVCGSAEHPAPHGVSSDTTGPAVDEESLSRANAAHQRAQRESLSLQIRMETAESALRAEGAEEAVDEEELAREVKTAKDAVAALRRRRLDLDAARRSRASASASLEAHRAAIGPDQTTLAEARARLIAALANVEQQRARIGDRDSSPSRLAAQLAALEADASRRREALRVDRARREEAAGRVAAAAGSLPTLRAEVERATAELAEAAEALLLVMGAGGIDDEAEITSAVLEYAERKRLRESLEARARAEATHAEALTSLGPDEPAPSTTTASEPEARAHLESLQRELGVAQSSVVAMQRQRAAIAAAAEARGAAETRSLRVRRVSEAANGKGPTRVRLSRYVLLDLFDRVVASASAGLESMSDGRFRLRRQERAQTGREFDLVVDDSYVGGATRPAASLSGGEVFLASLAMALGLGEVLQAWAGGIRVESLFVDEGFGALDEDTIERAIELLERLPQHARMVGVISHVPELRKRIPARLEVLRGDHGSMTRCSLRHRGADR